MLFTPDLFNYFLTGELNTDYSIASTSQILDPWRKTWDETLLETVPFPREKLLPVTQAHMPVSYTHLDVYKRQSLASWARGVRKWPGQFSGPIR